MTNNPVDNNLEQAKVVASKASDFFMKYQKVIYCAIIAIVVAIAAVFAYKYFDAKKSEEAIVKVAEPQQTFNVFSDSLSVSVNYDEFVAHIDEFGDRAGKAVYLYAGADAYKIGEYEEAIANFEKYSGDAILEARALCAIADANVQLGNIEKAAAQYMEAAQKSENVFNAICLFKAGQAFEALENYEAALDAYCQVRDQYLNTPQGQIVEKYIARIEYR